MVETYRLKTENALINKRFPQFILKRLSDGTYGFIGTLKTTKGTHYKLLVQIPSNYPNTNPNVYIVSPKVNCKVHMFPDSRLCLNIDEDWSPDKTVVTCIGWAAHWLHNYEVYNVTGKWPARAV